MFGGNQPQGFTIIEVIIFLAVSGVLFLSVLNLISNSQNKTQFSQGIHEFYSQIQTLTNDVQIGYYNTNSNFSCSAAITGPPTIDTTVSQGQGKNTNCTYLGRVIVFAPNGDTSKYLVDTIVGRQFAPNSTTTLAASIDDASPISLAGGNNPSLGLQTVNLPPGLVISKISYTDNSNGSNTSNSYGTVGLLSSFPNSTTSSSLTSNLIPIPTTTQFINPGAPGLLTAVLNSLHNNGGSDGNKIYSNYPSLNCAKPKPNCSVINPSGGVQVCLQSTGFNNRYAIVTIGGNATNSTSSGNPLSTQLTVYQGIKCP
jgi:type II secretory pathway pseudopilin PulG